MVLLADPTVESVEERMEEAIRNYERYPDYSQHEELRGLYSWRSVAERTERVYEKALEEPDQSLANLCLRNLALGVVSGTLGLISFILSLFFLFLFDLIFPRTKIEPA